MIESLPQSEPVLLPDRPFGRQARSVIGYSLLTALMIVARMPVFVPAALVHCAWRNGRRAGWAVLAISVLLVTAYAASVPAAKPDLRHMIWSSLAGVVLTIALPAMAAIPLVERAEKFGRVLMVLLAGALVGLTLTEVGSQSLLSFSPYAAQVEQAGQLGTEVVQLYRANKMPSELIRMAERASTFSTYVLPAQLLMALTLVYTLSLMMVGRLRAWQNQAASRPPSEVVKAYLFRNFELPEWLLFAFVFGGLTPLVGGLLQKVAANTLVVVVFLYILQGLAVFRSMLLAIGAGVIGTVIGWAALAMMFPLSMLLLGVAGLFDPFFDFRHFKKRKDDSHESHSD
jgi:hypothetical protein